MLKEKIKKNYKIMIGIVIGMVLSLTGVYAAACISAGDVAFGSKTGLSSSNVQDALDELNEKSNKCTGGSNTASSSEILCKRATTLHSVRCEGDNMAYCNAANPETHMSSAIYNEGDTLNYGKISASGLNVGDAFDCDVNGDGNYDSETERFYYISDYYDTSTRNFNSDYASLIYYTNVKDGVPSLDKKYQWNPDFNMLRPNENEGKGPSTAITALPTTTQWKNTSLYKTTRTIATDNWSTTYVNDFSYEGYAARLLTSFEYNKGCIEPGYGNIANNCQFIEENQKYINNESRRDTPFWLETVESMYREPQVIATKYNLYKANGDNEFYVRPVIDVKKTRIEY